MSIITEVVVDDSFTVDPDAVGGLSVVDLPERIEVITPEDYTGSLAFTYTANDEKGAVSDRPAIIVFNVTPERERPDAVTDSVDLFENGSVAVAVFDLLLNDRDDDGDAMRILAFGPAGNGAAAVTLATVTSDAPASLTPLAGGTWSGALPDGSALPDWIAIDPATGALTAIPPLDVLGDFDIAFTNSDGASSHSATATFRFDGNAGAFVTYAPAAGFAGLDTLTYTLTDDHEGTAQGTVLFNVASLLDPPVAVTDYVSVLEDGVLTLTPADLLANDYDVDGNAIRFLGVADGTNGAVSFDGATITFTPSPDYNGPATFTYSVTDDTHGDSVGLVEVNVISTNRRPEAVTDVFATVEDTPFEFTIDDLFANDTDPDGDAVRFMSIQSSSSDARILELPGGRYQFVPDENINGLRSFSYVITDGRLTDRGTITFDIEAVNDAPIGNPDGPFFGEQGQPFAIDFADLIFNDRDVEGDSFAIVEVFDGDNGTVCRDGDTAVFQGRAGYFGDGGFFYRVTDEHGATDVGYASVLVMPLFDVPVAVSDAGFEMLEDSFLDIDPAALMANDDIPPGSEVIFLGLTGRGVTLLDSGPYRVTADPDFFGTLTLRYALTNETGFEAPTTVTINVLPVSDAPVAVDDRLTLREDQPLVIFVSHLTDNDYDVDRDAITLTRILGTDNVTVEVLDNGQLVITPDADFTGIGGFDYELRDSTGITATAHVTVQAESVNDAPEIADLGVLSGDEDAFFTATIQAGAITDADGDALLIELRGPGGTALPDWLGFDAETRTVSGMPPADFNGDVAVELAAFDGQVETVRDLTIRIAPVNDALEAVSVAMTLSEDDAALEIDLLAGASDIDGDTLGVTGAVATASDGRIMAGIVTVTGGAALIVPSAFGDLADGQSVLIEIAYGITDGVAVTPNVATVTVTGANDLPRFALGADPVFETPENAAAVTTLVATDQDGDALTFSLAPGGADSDLFTLNAATGALTFKTAPDFEAPVGGDNRYDLLAEVSDGAGTVMQAITVNVTPVNEAPRPVGDIRRVNNRQEVIFVLGNDADPEGDALEVASVNGAPIPGDGIVFLPSGAALLSLGGGAFTYVALDAGAGAIAAAPAFDSFSYTLIDAHGAESAPAEVVLEIVPTVTQGTQGANLNMVGTTGGDVLMPLRGADAIDIGQGGLDVVAGTGEELAGDLILGIDHGDAIRIDEAWLTVADVDFDGRHLTVTGGAAPDWLIDLGPDMARGRFAVSQTPTGTQMTYQRIDPVAQVLSLSLATTAVTVTLDHAFLNPVAFALSPSINDGAPVAVRIIAAAGDQVTLRLQEPNAADGIHAPEDVTLFVVEAGTHTLADGTVLQAGTLDTNKMVARGFVDVAFDDGFDAAPAIFSQVQTANGLDYVVTRQKDGSTAGFAVSMQEEEGNDFHAAETIGWLAIDQGAGGWSGLAFAAGSLTHAVNGTPTPDAFDAGFVEAPNLFASLSTYAGRDQAAPRMVAIDADGFNAIAQEDTSFDAETAHARESFDWLAIEGEGLLYAGAEVAVVPDMGFGTVMAETGRISINHVGATVTLAHAFANPVVIATVNTVNGPEEVVARISDVTSRSFFVQLQEPDHRDGTHAWEDVSFMVVEAGTWRLPDGSVLRVGLEDMSGLSASGFTPIACDAGFTAAPSVLAQVQTLNDAAFVKARIDGRDGAGFGLALEEDEAGNGGAHGVETVGWVALDRGPGVWTTDRDVFVFDAGGMAADSAFAADSFAARFAATPILLAGVASAADPDPAQLRMTGLTSLGVVFRIEEDRAADRETLHAIEQIDWIAIGGEGLLIGEMIL
jgi:hypothetical protein